MLIVITLLCLLVGGGIGSFVFWLEGNDLRDTLWVISWVVGLSAPMIVSLAWV